MSEEHRDGSTVNHPDPDWSQIREIVLMLELLAALVRAAMRDSDNSVTELATGFSAIAQHGFRLSMAIDELPETPELAGRKAAMNQSMGEMRSLINQSVVAFQFYDRLVQRLTHVVQGQADFAETVEDRSRRCDPAAWEALRERVRRSFSMQEEHLLLDAVLKGVPVEQAINEYVSTLQAQHNEIELF